MLVRNTSFTTVVPALVKLGEAVVSVGLGLTAVGSVLETVNNTQDSNVALTRAERIISPLHAYKKFSRNIMLTA